MTLTKEQTKRLLGLIVSSKPDEIECDGCYQHMAEFVELELLGNDMPRAIQRIQRHVDQCPCCQDEHSALIEALQAIDG